MSSIRLATAANVLAFQNLTNALETSEGKWAHLIESDGLQDEIGRFRVWSGNLGALQKGHSSLDYRLRDSPLLSTNTLKFLKELEDNINEAFAIVSGARLPYELQPKPEVTEEHDDDDDFFDQDDDDEDDDGSRTELSMRFSEIVDIIDNLYKLSVRIRTPTIRTRSLKAATYKPKDPETGIDILSTYAEYDLQHVRELLRYLRHPHEGEAESGDSDYLATRLSAAVTLRRRQFKYWKRHRDKLGMSAVQEEETSLEKPVHRPELAQRNDTIEVLPGTPLVVRNKDATSQKTGKTLLSGTEATQHHQTLDEIVDTKSVTSYAVTVKDLHGKGVELPPPPRAADGEKDFECPYCYIICPARYGRGRAWRTHLLQDLQPYVCTYPNCDSSEQLFRSRREWAEHEATHRKAWRCPEHPNAMYKTSSGLEDHFRCEHVDSFPENQVLAMVKVGETNTVDERKTCPICSAPADIEGLGDFHNHIANHLERFATFALPNGREDDSDGASSAASRGRSESSESRNLSDLSLPIDIRDEYEAVGYSKMIGSECKTPEEPLSAEDTVHEAAPGVILSAESLNQVPDGSQDRLGTLFNAQRQPGDAEDTRDTDSESSGYYVPASYSTEDGNQLATLTVADIPTVRSLYRTRRLQQRDQSFAPNDTYNQIVSFCHHDLTKLKVDAIVNSANKSLKMTGGKTLNNAIHRAAGSDLATETRSAGKLDGHAILTGGYDLPSKHVIHVLRPGYSRSNGMGQFNQLIDCYREALRVAIDNNLKTIAFPCLGTGGVGFPARVAARITLQEIREYLDGHPEHRLERIIFCVNTATDEKAYIDFLPVYFPPTHDDLESARGIWSEDYAAQAIQILDTRNEIQKVFSELNLGLSLSVDEFPRDVLTHFAAIDAALASIRRFLLWSNELNKNMRDLKLLCTVLQLFCGNVTETIDLAKDHANLGQRSDKSIWDDYVSDMNSRLQTNPSEFLQLCRNLVEGLDNMITGNGYDLDEIMEMVETRQTLERYKVKQRGGREGEGTQDHLNEVLYTREFQRESIARARDTVKLYQIRSVAQLYSIGELQEKPTLAQPSEMFNDKVYLVREDVTKLEVDIMVNSTDIAFRGMGTLDRTVLQKGGEQLRSAVMAFGKCQVGDVRSTGGYSLPAKHVLHVVPPEIYNKDAKSILKKIYREVLHEAARMRATSVALPSIGTGMLNYPRRDCASLAMEEVKRFLESAERNSPLEKIIFVVYSSNDEFVYKSLLPVYFPPLNAVSKPSPRPVTRQDTGVSAISEASDTPRRTLFGSIGEAFRSVRLGKQSETPRSITANEEHALIEFESHAKYCETCSDVDKLYLAGRDLCKDGYFLAQTVLWHMNMQSDQEVYTKPDIKGQSVRLELPTEMFPISMQMLSTVEKSYRDKMRSRPFVTPNRSYGAITQDQGTDPSQASGSDNTRQSEPKRARARVLATLNSAHEPSAVSSRESQIQIHPDRVDVFQHVVAGVFKDPLLSLRLNRYSVVERFATTPEVELNGITHLPTSVLQAKGKVSFRCRSDNECNQLLRAIRQAIVGVQGWTSVDTSEIVMHDTEVQKLTDSNVVDGVTASVNREGAEAETTMTLGDRVHVSSGMINVHSGFGVMGESPLLFSLQLHASSTAHWPNGTSDAVVRGATHLLSSYHTTGNVTFRCQNENSRDRLLNMVWREVDRLKKSGNARADQETVVPPAKPDQGSFNEFVQWNKRLIDIRSELAGVKKASGGLSDLQHKMERLSAATSTLSKNPQVSSDASNLFDPSRSALATRILLCLTADLKSRPGSYIGLDTDSIVSAVGTDKQETVLALRELVAEDQVHNTVDDDTWVITHAPKDLPVLSKEQFESGMQDAGTAEDPSKPGNGMTATHLSNRAMLALEDLVPEDQIHPTMDEDQSHSVTQGTDAANERPKSNEKAATIDPSDQSKKYIVCSACDNPLAIGAVVSSTKSEPSQINPQDLGPTAQEVYAHLREFAQVPEDGGLHILDIAKATGRTHVEVGDALATLEAQGMVHVHGVSDMWWAATTKHGQPKKASESKPASNIVAEDKPWPKDGPPHATTGSSASAVAPAKCTSSQEDKQFRPSDSVDRPTDSEQPSQPVNNTMPHLNPSTEKVHTYLLNYTFAPPDGAHHILDIAAAVYLTREEVRQALAELKDLGLANVSGKNGWWWATKAEPGQNQKESVETPPTTSSAIIQDAPALQDESKLKDPENSAAETTALRKVPEFNDIPPSPILATVSSRPLDLDKIHIDDYFTYTSPSGARWTRIDRALVDPEVLIAAGEEFDNVRDGLIVRRVLRRGEIRRWAEESVKRRGDEKGKGKGREKRDEDQEKLDRVIAGDMKEDELRRYGDGKD